MNNFFCYLYTKFSLFWSSFLSFLGFIPEKEEGSFQEGILTVVGADSIELELNSHPREISVVFIDEVETASCNPHQDTIDYKLSTDCNCKYFLKIKWDVSNVRTVFWHVEY